MNPQSNKIAKINSVPAHLCLFLGILSLIFPSFSYAKGGTLSGKVQLSTGIPLEYATVTVFETSGSRVISGAVTNSEGWFSIKGLKPGSYFITIKFIGYRVQKVDEIMIAEGEVTQLGVIYLSESETELNTVEIVGQSGFSLNKIDRRVYDPNQLIIAQGGTVNEVLQNIPSVQVDVDGNISLRGNANIQILIDGRPSGITDENAAAFFESLPANSIESVEVITNPAAKYDPDGMAGILNIVTKKNKIEGVNGLVSATAGTGSNHNAAAMLNYRKNKWNLYSNYGFNYRDLFKNADTYRENFLEDSIFIQNQKGVGSRRMLSNMIKLGGAYSLNEKNTLGLGVTYSDRKRDSREFTTYELQNSFDLLEVDSWRDAREEGEMRSVDINLDYDRDLRVKGSKLSVGGRQSLFFMNHEGRFNNIYPSESTAEQLQKNKQISKNRTTTFQLDYTLPLKKINGILEAGAKSIIRKLDGDFTSVSLDTTNLIWYNDAGLTNRFVYNEQIHAIYATYQQNIKKFGIQAGVRTEETFTDAKLVNTDSLFVNQYFNFYPTLHAHYWLPSDQQIKLSYSRRVNRPRPRVLNPFPNYTDPLNIREGNPFLLPEYIHAFELSYDKYFNQLNLSASLYLQEIRNMITRIKTVENGISTTQFINFGKARNYGLELILTGQLTNWLNLTASGNAFRTELQGEENNGELNTEGYQFNSKVLATFQLPWNLSIQASANYQSPKIIPQGMISQVWFADLALKMKVLKDKGTVTVRISDVFNTREFNFETEGDNFFQDSYRKRESRNVFVGFSYAFGRVKKGRNRTGGMRENKMDAGREDGIEID